jgi:hypothetical protein
MSQFIAEWTSPIDPGGGNPPRTYYSTPIQGNYDNLWATFTVNGGWSGGFNLEDEGTVYWFNRFPQPSSPFTEHDPSIHTTRVGERMVLFTNNGAAGLQVTVDLFGDPPGTSTSGVCQYGTRVQPAFQRLSIGAATLVTLVAEQYGWVWLATIFDGVVSALNVSTDMLCNGPPPALPQITAADLLPAGRGQPPKANFDTIVEVYEALLWPLVCECNPNPPGQPPPTPATPPTLIIPPNVPTNITLPSCDQGDLCTLLNRIYNQVGALAQQVNSISQYVTLIQRQKVPFAYSAGRLHSGLSGSGQFNVQGLIGLAVELTTLPPGIGETSDDPTIYFRAGWVATGTPDGWRRSSTISHNPMWIDVQPDDTLVGWTFTPGVIGNLQEFVREP